ncbi:uncharacterized protein [Drosophila takahashii]|uniref:uncharacterized protein n=1 Tax=Drosophila takahashii TaxID=29030 RepID=UPI003898F943
MATKCGSKDFPYLRYGSLPQLTLDSLLVSHPKPEDSVDSEVPKCMAHPDFGLRLMRRQV